MFSTYTVTTLADDGTAGTLRYGIENAGSGPQTIVFSPTLAGGTIDLEDDGGTLTVDHSSGQITIQAPQGNVFTLSAHDVRDMSISAGTTVELDNLVITGGNDAGEDGGGIQNLGTLTLNDCSLTGNVANGNGGGIEVAPLADGSGAMDVNPYKVDFNLPSSLAAGSYNVQVYNGHGGVNGLSAPSTITVAAAPALYDPSVFTVTVAAGYWDSDPDRTAHSTYLLDGTINPGAVNDAISFANAFATMYGYTYVGIQLPAGTINITDSSDIIQLLPYVHLIGAGDTGNPATGTVIKGAGPSLACLVELYSYAGNPCPGDGLSDMTLKSNGDVTTSVVYNNSVVTAFILQDVTIDASSDNPANPAAVEDVVFSQAGSSHLQFLDCTFIGQGIAMSMNYSTVDNCHFIGCGAANAQIQTPVPVDLSITRCTATSLVNNILSIGGNVEYDSADRLLAVYGDGPGLYVGDNSTSDLYSTNKEVANGEQISVEVATGGTNTYNQDVAIYQNTLSGDGAESLSVVTVGLNAEVGQNLVVADNDISNVEYGIQVYSAGGDSYYSNPFAMYTGNSIHNVDTGFFVQTGASALEPNIPWYIGCSFSDNVINAGQPGSIGFSINMFSDQTNSPPQGMMNIFNCDIVISVSTGVYLFTPSTQPGNQIGTLVISNGYFFANGINSSIFENDQSDSFTDPIVLHMETWQGFWTDLVN